MKFFYVILLMGSTFLSASDQMSPETEKLQKDREAILAMAGTFEVNFHFQETVSFDKDYEIKEAYDANALEIVIIDEETENRIVLQHILKTKHGIIKHWRQDWAYENRILWEYSGPLAWTKKELTQEEAKGTWTQRVFQVDDSPRYESFGEWTHDAGVSQWVSAQTNRPLPRREYTKRDDYDILLAVNRQVITSGGWVHEQDNDKLITRDGNHRILAREIGINTYKRVEQAPFSEVRQWWREHRDFWIQVRETWDEIFASQAQLNLKNSVDDKPMFRHFSSLQRTWADPGSEKDKDMKKTFRQLLTKFGVEAPAKAASN